MSKKTKRQTSRMTASTAASAAAPASGFARPTDRDFRPDYSYVVKDLKRIGILAGSFFLVLILLSFFL